jgi:hypothetical protein
MVTSLSVYPACHPVALALAGIALAARAGTDVLAALADHAGRVGVSFGSESFDDAAELVGVPYCRALDLYVDRATKRRADELGFERAHLAFVS